MVERLDKIRRRRFLEKSLAESLSAIGAPRAVLLGHLGLGDFFSEAPLIEMWSDLVDELVIVSPSESRSRLLSRVYSYLPNLIFEDKLQTSGDGNLKQLRYRFKAPLVQVGSRVLRLSSLASPGFGLNRKLCIGGLYARRTLSSARLRENLLALGAASIPARRFAFVDHHDLCP